MLVFGRMKKSELARAIAKQSRIKTGDAADHMDRAVTRIIRTLRKGNPAHLPGLGTLAPGNPPGQPWTFQPEQVEDLAPTPKAKAK